MLKSRLNYLAGLAGAPIAATPASEQPAPQVPSGANRRARRRADVINRRVSRRLQKDGIPVDISTAPDGGVHVHVGKPEEKKEDS